jgi:hypothetical protein
MSPQYPQLSSNEYLLNHIVIMRNQEKTSYKVSRDYFNEARDCMTSTGFTVSPSERKALLCWAYGIVDMCVIERRVAIMAISYLDRFLADNIDRCAHALSSRRNFQLCFTVCLFIALKNCVGMKVEVDFVTDDLLHGMHKESQILEMEMAVLQGLNWRLNGPTAIDFVHAFLKLLPNQDDCKLKVLAKAAEVQVELAMGDFSISLQEPSSIACSSIILAMNSGMKVNAVDQFVWMHAVAHVCQQWYPAFDDENGSKQVDGLQIRYNHTFQW